MQRNSMLCPKCGLLISLSEQTCPYCGLRAHGARWRRLLVFRLLGDPALLVKTVVTVNIGMFGLSLVMDPRTTGLTFNPLMLLSPSDRSLFVLGATGTIPIDSYQRWWTLVSASYLNGGLLHIFFNMAAFRQLSAVVVREYGTRRMFAIYTLGGVAGFVLSYLAGVGLTIGASAGVCGLVGAILYYGKSRGGANREPGAAFDLDAFDHYAFYEPREQRIEMHLLSRRAQTVHLCGQAFGFDAGEPLHTENSYKYTVEQFHALAREAGYRPDGVWVDEERCSACTGSPSRRENP